MRNKKNVIFMGTPDFAVPSLEKIHKEFHVLSVYTQPPKKSGRGLRTKLSPIHEISNDYNLPVKTPQNFKSFDIIEEIKNLKPDFIIVVAYGIILPKTVLDIPNFFCLNGHASDLPRWRGAAPIQRAIEAGDKTTAACAMIMEETLDTGPVIAKKKINILNKDTASSLHDKLSKLTANVLIESMDKIIQNKYKPIKQKITGITYANKITSNDTLINWSQNNEEILRKLRSLSNWPGGWTYHNQNRIRIHEAKKIEFSVGKENIKPGEFIGYSGNGSPIIQCGSNSFLEITQIQKEGKKKMNSQDFLRGYKINIGDKFRRDKM
ncbi:MAG: methionyl-tRNA formyltransferase [Alphaproteobacteria bacterium]|nr:MAG: methionyl-tRNA formyltransferase [Alphaproteobacteria bacterium]